MPTTLTKRDQAFIDSYAKQSSPAHARESIIETADELRTHIKRKEAERLSYPTGTLAHVSAEVRIHDLTAQLRIVEGDDSITVEQALGVKRRKKVKDALLLDLTDDGELAPSAFEGSVFEFEPALAELTGNDPDADVPVYALGRE